MKVDGRVVRGEQRREHILEKAQMVFAERGFHGTSMRDLATECGTSQALLHHHFGTKEALHAKAKGRVIYLYAQAQEPNLEADLSDAHFVLEVVRTYFSFFLARPYLVRLSTWSVLEQGDPSWGQGGLLTGRIVERIKIAQKNGVIRPDVHPLHLFNMVGGIISYWVQRKQHFAEQMGDVLQERTHDDAYTRQAMKTLVLGIGTADLIEEWETWNETALFVEGDKE
jgi:TetR/AcrR family transcriptional regulator